MAECFCGCGRTVTRGLNKQALRTDGLLAKLRELQEMGSADAETVQQLIEDGEGYRSTWKEVVHDDADPHRTDGRLIVGLSWASEAEVREFKQAWEAWGREGMGLCRLSGVKISRLGVFTGRL